MYIIITILAIVIISLSFLLYKVYVENTKFFNDLQKKNKLIADLERKIDQGSSELYDLRAKNKILIDDVEKSKKELHLYMNEFSEPISLNELIRTKKDDVSKLNSHLVELSENYAKKKVIYDGLIEKISIYDEDVNLIEMGFYKPHFDFNTSERYKIRIEQIRDKQKQMLKLKTAVICGTEWTVGNSKVEGRKMTNRGIRLTARAFNNECEAVIANVRWNNVIKMEERIKKSFEDINKLNESNQIVIDREYLNLKLNELWLVYEQQEKIKAEKDEQAEIRRQISEEAKLEQEALVARKEEEKYQRLLAKAQAEAAKAFGDNLDKLNSEIADLSVKLEEAHQKNERALSMAQQTRAGHVYVISNIGSFGEDIYKIGMTRRLEPLDRVKELGDASVPFYFDVHAMIYSEDAPAMENSLHKAFAGKRLNLVNLRKEFFNVTLDDIQEEVYKISKDADFVLTIEAQEYYQSQMIRKERGEKLAANVFENIPESI